MNHRVDKKSSNLVQYNIIACCLDATCDTASTVQVLYIHYTINTNGGTKKSYPNNDQHQNHGGTTAEFPFFGAVVGEKE